MNLMNEGVLPPNELDDRDERREESEAQMADNETTADIIAWLRRPREGENAYLTLWRDEIANRLDAAHKRERGNAAKLREAIENSNGLLEELAAIGEWGESAREQIAENNAALAAPPRNCDRFATAEEARQAWLDDAGNWDEFGSPKLELHEWLYAPATEKEGGANG